jgi:cytochrome P450
MKHYIHMSSEPSAESDFGRWEIPSEIASREGQLEPFEFYQQMRQENPVRYDEDRGVWDVFLYEDVVEVASNFDDFSSEGASAQDRSFDDEDAEDKPNMLGSDPPRHDELREVVEDYFKRNFLNQFRPELEDRAETLFDEALADGPEVEFIDDIARPFPAITIAEFLGIGTENLDSLIEWTETVLESPHNVSEEERLRSHRESSEAQQELADFFDKKVQQRKENPQDDIITKVTQTDKGGSMLSYTDIDATKFCVLLFTAGHITTTKLLSNAVWAFIEHDLIEPLNEGSVQLKPAIEEVLRYRSVAQSITRVATRDVEMRGEVISEGDPIIAWLGSAHRDPDVFKNPDTFDPTRQPNRHIGFGRGIHTCIGAPLARMEAEIILSEFLDRVEDAEITTDQLEPVYSRSEYGLEELPLSLSLST